MPGRKKLFRKLADNLLQKGHSRFGGANTLLEGCSALHEIADTNVIPAYLEAE